jgi:isocitrate/isopropylmalate dehydrogenase
MGARIAVFPGDSAAATAVEETVDVLEQLDRTLQSTILEIDTQYPADSEPSLAEGDIPEAYLSACERADSILFGTCDDTHAPMLRYLRYEFTGGMMANLRPVQYFDGLQTPLSEPSGIDMLLVRKNLEGLYYRAEGHLSELAGALPDAQGAGGRNLGDLGKGAYALRVASQHHTQTFAELAIQRSRNWFDHRPLTITAASKSNVLPETAGLFDDAVETAVNDEPDLRYEHLHADDVAQRLVADPGQFDVIVTPNYPGDILSDCAAGAVGGLGIAPSGCFAADGTAYFEPVHGAAPDIAGSGTINPTATLLSAAMLLDHENHHGAATRLRQAVQQVYANGEPLTPDQGGSASTTQFASAVGERL